jgi:hypothetical protein
MRARWLLGQALAEVERANAGRGANNSTGLTHLLKALGLTKQTAIFVNNAKGHNSPSLALGLGAREARNSQQNKHA